MSENTSRRNFLKILGIGAGAGLSAGLTPKIIGKTKDGYLVESEEEYGGFQVEKLNNGQFPYETNPDILKPMSNKMTVFSRDVWDPVRLAVKSENITYENLIKGEGKVPNQTRLDYALMAAAWKTARTDAGNYRWDIEPAMVRGLGMDKLGKWDPSDLDMSWEDVSLAVKHASRFYGVSLAGIADMNPLWLYSDYHSGTREDREHTIPVIRDGDRSEKADEAWYIPESMNKVVALAFEENYFGIMNSPGRLASAAVGDGYSRMAYTATTLADFIRGLGYRAIPAGNGVGLSIPIAIDAGLGELGRNGLLVTPKYGPRVRLAKVITDMPLVPDHPISFGVTEFCEDCMLCAETCPSESITNGPRTWEGQSVSNNPGTFKWYITGEPCNDFNGFSCSNCKRSCPFNKPNNSWLHKLTRKLVQTKVGGLNKVMVAFDQASGYGEELQDKEFWKMKGDKTITGRESM